MDISYRQAFSFQAHPENASLSTSNLIGHKVIVTWQYTYNVGSAFPVVVVTKPFFLHFHPLLRLRLCLFSFAMNFLLLISQLDDWLKLARSHMCDKESFSYKHMKQPPRKFLGRCDEDSIKRGNGRNVEFLSRLSHYKASYFSISHDTVFLKWKDGHLLQVTRGGTMNQLTISLFSQWLHLIWETLSNDDRYLSTLGNPKTWDMWHHSYYVSQKNPATKQIMGKWSCPNFEIFPHSSNENNCSYVH